MTTTQIPAEIAEQAAGRPVCRIDDDTFETTGPCGRCGGAGGYKGWPGFTCFRCQGRCVDPTPVRLYTAAKQAKLDAASAKRRAAKEAKAQHQQAAAEAANVALLPELVEIWAAIEADYDAETCSHRTISGFIQSVAGKAHIFEMSEKQVEALRSAWAKHLERIEARAAEKAAEAPVPTGKAIEVEGEVLTTKWVESQYGSAKKMLVKGDGWKIWTTVPSAILDVEQGQRVRFVADVDASDDDKAFGFARHPRKAQVIG
jgi:hypothetical protein